MLVLGALHNVAAEGAALAAAAASVGWQKHCKSAFEPFLKTLTLSAPITHTSSSTSWMAPIRVHHVTFHVRPW